MILDRFLVTDRVAIVTGAGRGIGAASAVALAEAGADVVISARNADQLAEVAARIEAVGRRAHVVPAHREVAPQHVGRRRDELPVGLLDGQVQHQARPRATSAARYASSLPGRGPME